MFCALAPLSTAQLTQPATQVHEGAASSLLKQADEYAASIDGAHERAVAVQEKETLMFTGSSVEPPAVDGQWRSSEASRTVGSMLRDRQLSGLLYDADGALDALDTARAEGLGRLDGLHEQISGYLVTLEAYLQL